MEPIIFMPQGSFSYEIVHADPNNEQIVADYFTIAQCTQNVNQVPLYGFDNINKMEPWNKYNFYFIYSFKYNRFSYCKKAYNNLIFPSLTE